MKKIILLLLLVLITSPCFSQITRTIWGLTLGRSTKQQVRTVLVQKGYRSVEEPDGNIGTVNSDVFFAGITWSYASFAFVNGVLSEISFMANENESYISVDRIYEKLYESLDNKYKRYSQYFPPSNDGSKISSYSDNVTSSILMVHTNKGVRFAYLSYRDENLYEKKQQNYSDEL